VVALAEVECGHPRVDQRPDGAGGGLARSFGGEARERQQPSIVVQALAQPLDLDRRDDPAVGRGIADGRDAAGPVLAAELLFRSADYAEASHRAATRESLSNPGEVDQRLSRNSKSRSSGRKRPVPEVVQGSIFSSVRSFMSMLACRYIWVVSTCS
jgi:hypothetical protein